MGYYDQDYQDQNRKKKGNRGGYFFASLVGVIIGALIVLFAIPKLAENNLLPYSIQPDDSIQNEATQNTNDNGTKNSTNVSVNVDTDVTKAVNKANDAVVGITNLQSSGFWADDENQEAGSGSGVIYKKAGNKAYVVTNNHVVEGASELEVTLSDGTKASAKLLGSDIWTDLAVLEINAKSVKKVAEFGDSDTLKLGEPVIAIGNPLGQAFSGSVTQGIVSGLNRAVPVDINSDGSEDWQSEVIQTDAAINPGNSGGALINLTGQVIGINSMKIAQEEVEGIGFSIPINSAIPVINDLEKKGKVDRPFMGLELQSVNEIPAYYQQEALKLPSKVKDGVAIKSVTPNSPADKAGLKELDVIVELDGQKVSDVVALRKHLYTEKKIGDTMKVKYYRDGKLKETTMKLGKESL